jgi:two-component system alkaline phosphatase synthesis response regulator PhoP
MPLIYITEDDENIRELLIMALTGFSYEAAAFEYAEDAIAACDKAVPSLFIFDIMLPGMDGVSAVRQLRQRNQTKRVPILMLTAKDAETDKIKGLDAGADDYLSKPFGVMELAARIRALLRRSGASDDSETAFGDLAINFPAREVRMNGSLIELTFKEFELLTLLVRNKDRVVPREELLNTIWGFDFFGETRTLDAHIKSLRQKLGSDENRMYIKTIRNVGYRFFEENA